MWFADRSEGEAFRTAVRWAALTIREPCCVTAIPFCVAPQSNRVAKASIPHEVCPPTFLAQFELKLIQEVKLFLIYILASTTGGCMAETADFTTFGRLTSEREW